MQAVNLLIDLIGWIFSSNLVTDSMGLDLIREEKFEAAKDG